jgi:hypothetical protein
MIALLALPPMLLAGFAAFIRLCRSLAAGAGLLVAVYVVSALSQQPIGFLLAGINLYVEDLAGLAICLAAVARLTIRPVRGNRPVAWLLFTAAVTISFAAGSAMYGIKAAGVEFRTSFYLCAVVLYCASFRVGGRQLRTIVAVWLAGAAALAALAWFRWCAGALHLGLASSWAAVGGGNPLRVLTAGQTFYLAQALLMMIYLRRHTGTRQLLNAAIVLLGGTIVVLQHRSVWVALVVAAGAIAWHEHVLKKFAVRVAVAGLIGIGMFLLIPERFSRGNAVAASLKASVEEPFDMDRSTFGWRLVMWRAYLLEYAGAPGVQKIFGTGQGNPAGYAVSTEDVELSAHNYFVNTLNRVGATGLAALAAVGWAMLRRLRGGRGYWDYLGLLFAASLGLFAYCTVYSPSYDQGLLIGAVFGIASGRVSGDQQSLRRDSRPQPA